MSKTRSLAPLTCVTYPHIRSTLTRSSNVHSPHSLHSQVHTPAHAPIFSASLPKTQTGATLGATTPPMPVGNTGPVKRKKPLLSTAMPVDDVVKVAKPVPATAKNAGPAKHKKPLLVVPTKGEVNEDPPAVSNTAVSPVSPVNPVKKANPVAHISLWVTLCLLHTRTTPDTRMLLR